MRSLSLSRGWRTALLLILDYWHRHLITAIPHYNTHASALAQKYEFLSAASAQIWLVDQLAKTKTLTLDVGVGSGRDAALLVSLRFEVIAVEPSAVMRVEAQRLHHPEHIQSLDALLPDFQMTQRLGLSFTVNLLSAVWMHFPPADRKIME